MNNAARHKLHNLEFAGACDDDCGNPAMLQAAKTAQVILSGIYIKERERPAMMRQSGAIGQWRIDAEAQNCGVAQAQQGRDAENSVSKLQTDIPLWQYKIKKLKGSHNGMTDVPCYILYTNYIPYTNIMILQYYDIAVKIFIFVSNVLLRESVTVGGREKKITYHNHNIHFNLQLFYHR